MTRVLKGEALTFVDVLIPLVVAIAVAVTCIAFVAASLPRAASHLKDVAFGEGCVEFRLEDFEHR